jgi:hypothetical protein
MSSTGKALLMNTCSNITISLNGVSKCYFHYFADTDYTDFMLTSSYMHTKATLIHVQQVCI